MVVRARSSPLSVHTDGRHKAGHVGAHPVDCYRRGTGESTQVCCRDTLRELSVGFCRGNEIFRVRLETRSRAQVGVLSSQCSVSNLRPHLSLIPKSAELKV
jgi:hypothetical protein